MRPPKTHLAIAVVLLSGLLSIAWAQELPADETVAYWIHELPDDPNSAVTLSITLTLHADDSDSGSVGWQITEVEFRQPGTGGASDTVWTESFPSVNSADGLWWVEHSDPGDPQPSEFSWPPLLTGDAVAVDPANADLSYALEGLAYTPPPEGAPYTVTAAFQYSFSLLGESAPFLEGEDEPVEVPPESDPPVSGT